MAKRLSDRSKSMKSFSDLLPRKKYLTVWHSQFGHIPEIEREAELKSPTLFESFNWLLYIQLADYFFCLCQLMCVPFLLPFQPSFDTGDLSKSMPAIAHCAS